MLIPTLLGNLPILVEESKKDKLQALKIFNSMVCNNQYFDYSLIRLLRRMNYNFIEVNHDIAIKGMMFEKMLKLPYQEFNENVVIKDGEDATIAIYPIASIVLRIQISIVICDVRDVRPNLPIQTYQPENQSIDFKIDDSLNFHKRSLAVLYKQGHYDIIYRKEDAQDRPLILEYDTLISQNNSITTSQYSSF